METEELIILKREEAIEKAYVALSGYKFWMFGYHAAAWVKYNQLLPRERQSPNPFRCLVDAARAHMAVREQQLEEQQQLAHC